MSDSDSTVEVFDLVIIGSGSGLSLVGDDLKDWAIALIDKGTGVTGAFGGTCLNAGCIPTKMFSLPARYANLPNRASGVDTGLIFGGINHADLIGRVFGRTDAVSRSGLAGLQARSNVTVIRGDAEFIGDHQIKVGHRVIAASRIVLAAGSRPRPVRAPGFTDDYLHPFVHTSESIMRLPELPRRLVIVGAGVEAVEFGHIFSALGSKVSIIARGEALLRHGEPDISRLITEEMSQRVSLRFNQRVAGLEAGQDGGVVVTAVDVHGIEYTYQADAVLESIGRVPNGDQLHLDRTGITLDEAGFVPVDEYLRTGVPGIWALGDVCAPRMLKHLANAQARVVKKNLLADRDGDMLSRIDERCVPAGIFGDPEIATVGATTPQLEAEGRRFVAYNQAYDDVAYGWAMGPSCGMVRVLVDPQNRRLLGAHIIGEQATSLIQPLVMSMQFDMDLERFARGQYWIHPALTETVENAVLGALKQIRAQERD